MTQKQIRPIAKLRGPQPHHAYNISGKGSLSVLDWCARNRQGSENFPFTSWKLWSPTFTLLVYSECIYCITARSRWWGGVGRCCVQTSVCVHTVTDHTRGDLYTSPTLLYIITHSTTYNLRSTVQSNMLYTEDIKSSEQYKIDKILVSPSLMVVNF